MTKTANIKHLRSLSRLRRQPPLHKGAKGVRRWTEGVRAAGPSQSASLTALPEGEPRGWRQSFFWQPCLSLWERWPSAARTERVRLYRQMQTSESKAVPFRGKWHGDSRDERGLTFLIRKVSKRILIRFEIPGIRQYGRPVSFCGRKKRSFALIQLCAGFCPLQSFAAGK